jgi:hypothetical protein
MKRYLLITLFTFITITLTHTAQANDPLPNAKLPAGQIKKLGADFIVQVLGTGIHIAAEYLTDYSNASFQLERAFWSEGRSHLYEDWDVQTFRRIDWISSTRAKYVTERLLIDRTTGIKEVSDPEFTAFSDYEEARRYWRSYFHDGSSYERIEAWAMQIQHRLRNTYYKEANFASKQLEFPASVRVYARLKRIPAVVINGINHNFSPGYYTGHMDIAIPSKLGVSSNFNLLTRANTRLDCDHVPELWVPGEDDRGNSNTQCP